MQLRRWITVIVVALVVLAAIVYGFMPKAVGVDTARASRGPMKVTVEEEGKTRVRDLFVLSAPIAGFMRRITFDVGDKAQRGQTLVELEPLRSELLDPRSRAAAEAGVSAAEASLRAEEERMRAVRAETEYGRSNLERSRKLFKDGLISRDAIEQVEAAATRSEASLLASVEAVRVARSELDRAKSVLRNYSVDHVPPAGRIVPVRAPVNGSILRIHRQSEGAVQPGEPLIDIGDPQKLEVKVEASRPTRSGSDRVRLSFLSVGAVIPRSEERCGSLNRPVSRRFRVWA
jgi:HlyD family secretion protein